MKMGNPAAVTIYFMCPPCALAELVRERISDQTILIFTVVFFAICIAFSFFRDWRIALLHSFTISGVLIAVAAALNISKVGWESSVLGKIHRFGFEMVFRFVERAEMWWKLFEQ